MSELHLIGGEKGGVGKSVVARLLAQYWLDRAKSFKTRDRYGNLQLTFFASTTAPLAFKLDADIDDAGGIEHAFQVLDHWMTHGETHPFDIHEILTFYQRLDTGYELVV